MLNTLELTSLTPLALILIGAVFVHACFQLSVSVLTLLSSHTIGRRLSNTRLLNLNFWYILGVFATTSLLVLGAIAGLHWGMTYATSATIILTFSIIPLIALFIVLFYYRKGRGTQLWLPRPATEYITARAKRTKSSVESFALGVTTAFTELPFALAPIVIISFAFQEFSSSLWLYLAVSYSVAVCLPLIFVAFYLSSGHKVSSVQRWRESSKNFLRWSSAGALLLLTVYTAVLQSGAIR